MKNKWSFFLVLLMILCDRSIAGEDNTFSLLKPRIVVLTDVSTWETDDSESLVRLFAYADLFEIEALIYTTGWSLGETRDDFFNLIYIAIDAYGKDLPNMMKRSSQEKHLLNENKQVIGYWPSANYLRERTVFGSRKRGMEFIGKDNDVAQSIWRVEKERSENELSAFLRKIPIYAITDQDRDQRPPFDISSHQWIRREFEKDLLFLWDESAWMYQNGTGKNNWKEYETNIQGHGHLGNVYPKYKFGVEGDTPSFLYVMPNGLNNPLKPSYAGWGGYFEWGIGPYNETYAYNNHQGCVKEISNQYESYFYPTIFRDFAARMDWAKDGSGNHNPIVVINDQTGIDFIEINTTNN